MTPQERQAHEKYLRNVKEVAANLQALLDADDVERKAEDAVQKLLEMGNKGPFVTSGHGGLVFRDLVRDAVRGYKGTDSFVTSFRVPVNLDDPQLNISHFIRAANILYWEAKHRDTALAGREESTATTTQTLDTGRATASDVARTSLEDRARQRRGTQRRTSNAGRRKQDRRNLDMGISFRGIAPRNYYGVRSAS